MPLAAEFLEIREHRMRAGIGPLATLTLAQARAAEQAAIEATAEDEREPVYHVTERIIPGPVEDLPVRIYRPNAEPGLGVLVYFHGGGWVLGSVELSDEVCRSLANSAGCVVVAVGYRLAPEAKFPAAVEDGYAATCWVAAHPAELGVDPSRLAVGGDSAGGNIATVVTMLARERGGPDLVGQLLIYPNTDLTSDTESMRENTDPWFLNKDSVAWFQDHYLATPDESHHPSASPLLAEDLRGLPPALVITAEYDPLRDQAEQYARKLADAGVSVTLTRYDGMPHGFFSWFGMLDAAAAGMTEAVTQLRAWVSPTPPQ